MWKSQACGPQKILSILLALLIVINVNGAVYTPFAQAEADASNDITAFEFAEQTSPATIDTVSHTVTASVYSDADLSNVIPEITVSDGANISPASGEAQNFTNPVIYTVTAADGSAQEWVVTVPASAPTLSDAKEITSFELAEQTGPAIIDTVSHTVTGMVYGADLSNLTPEIIVSEGASISPDSGEAQDFINPVTYTVTAADGSEQDWVVTIYKAEPHYSDAKEITGFELAEQTSSATIDAVSHTVMTEVSYGTDLTNLTPTITISEGASISPDSGTAQDFTNPFTYTVTAADGSTQEWIVTVKEAPGDAKEITSFVLAEQTGTAEIDAISHTVTAEVYYGTDLNNLTPTITVSEGASITPSSGKAQDFTNPVIYMVTAADKSQQEWVVTVTEGEPGDAPEIIWEKTLGGTGDDTAYCVIQTKDEGYVFTGSADNQAKIYVGKTDSFGNVLWKEKYGGYGTTVGRSVYGTKDGGFIIAGYRKTTISSNDKVYLLKTNASGKKAWDSSISIPYTKCKGYSVQQTNDGGFIVAGSTLSGGQTDIYLVKTDKSGKEKWHKTYGGPGWDTAYSVQQTSDGGYILAGVWEGATDDAFLIKTDAGGVVQWKQPFGTPSNNEQAKQVMETSDGGYIISGYNGAYDYWLIKTDRKGKQIWDNHFDYGTCIGYSVDQTKDKGYVTAGMTGGNGIYLVQTDDSGEKIWKKKVGEGEDTAYSVLQSSNGDYLVAGSKNGDAYLACLGEIRIKVDVTAEYDRDKGKLSIISKATCPDNNTKTVLNESNTKSAFYELLDVNGDPLDYKGDLVYNSETLEWEAKDIDVSMFKNQMYYLEVSFNDKHGHAGSTITPLEKARLIVSTPHILPKGGYVHIYAMAVNDNGQLITSGDADLKIEITGYEDNIALNDSGIEGWDKFANDGVYGCPIQHITEPVTIDLYLGDQKVDSKKVSVVPYPNLAVITDVKALYDEFVDTGMGRIEDLNNNNLVDFYELIERLSNYADDHNGVVFDLPMEITLENGYSSDYDTYNYEDDNESYWMGCAIDQFIKKIGDATDNSFKNIAIIGDDEVVPFFRRTSPSLGKLGSESHYPNNVGTHGNRTLKDSGMNYIMTDIPYANFDDLNPDLEDRPKLDMGFGRIFARKPSALINNINAYEGNIDVSPISSSASLFNVKNDKVFWEKSAREYLTKILNKQYLYQQGSITEVPPASPGYYYWYNGAIYHWGKELSQAINNTDVNLLWTHADHLMALTALVNDKGERAWVHASDYDAAPAPGHLFICEGCHSGYSISHQSTENDYSAYDNALVNKMLEKQVAYFAPSTYGVLNKYAPAYHELLLQKFLENIFDVSKKTIGDALVSTYHQYWSTKIDKLPPSAQNKNIYTYSAYGVAYYGLPTQGLNNIKMDLPDELPDDSDKTGNAGLFSVTSASSPKPGSLSFNVDVPNFKESKDDSGRVLFEVPNGGTLLTVPFAPAMPMVVKTFNFPSGTVINGVNINSQSTNMYSKEVDIVPNIPINLTTGPLQGTIEVNNPYPDKIFWWNTYKQGGEVVLTVCVVPMQYNPDTKQVTMYNHLKFDVDYTKPYSDVNIDSVTVNSNQAINVDSTSVPVELDLSSHKDKEVSLYWAVKDPDSLNLATGIKVLHLRSGSNQAQFSLNTKSWGAGVKGLTVTIAEEVVLDTQNQDFVVQGINIDAKLSKDSYSVSDINGVLKVEVRNEQGDMVDGLASNDFSLFLNGETLPISYFIQTSPGIYSIQFPLNNITEGMHYLTVDCKDKRGLKKSVELCLNMEGSGVITPYVPPTITSGLGSEAVVGEEQSFQVTTLLTRWTKINDETVTSATYTVDGLEPEVPHSFAVSAVDLAGNESGLSNVASVSQHGSTIINFKLPGQIGHAAIDAVGHTITLKVPHGTDLRNLIPNITVSEGVSINPTLGEARDFTNPVTYTVTAEDGSTQVWTVTVTKAAPILSDAKDITSFELPDQTSTATINTVSHTVTAEVTQGTELSNLVPRITVSQGASISPVSGEARDFTNPVTYTVTAEDGSTQVWTVTVTEEESSYEPPVSSGGGSNGGSTFVFKTKEKEYVPAKNTNDLHLIKFTFAFKIKDIALDKIYVVDEEGNKISGSTARINGNTLIIANANLIGGNTYTVVIPKSTIKRNNSAATNGRINWSFTAEIKNYIFVDVSPEYWAFATINEFTKKGFISGYSDGTFRPNKPITRAEFCRVIINALGLSEKRPENSTFIDVNPGDWYYGCVETAAKAGIVKGYSNGEFGPNKNITREEIAAILIRIMGTDGLNAIGDSTSFKDNSNISPWAMRSVVVATQAGLICGYSDNNFRPNNNATRAEACVMIKRLLDIYQH